VKIYAYSGEQTDRQTTVKTVPAINSDGGNKWPAEQNPQNDNVRQRCVLL